MAAITLSVFGRAIDCGFVYDDVLYVQNNPEVQQGLTLNGIGWAFTHAVSNNWHPLTVISYMVDYQFYRLNPHGFHLTNVILHAITVVLLFLALKEVTGTLWRSAFVAAIFAIHPLRTESVVWISERKDVLSGLFFMLTLWAYFRYARRPFSLVRYLWIALPFTLGLMCKPMLVTAPFLLLLLDYWPLNRFQNLSLSRFRFPKRIILEKIPLVILSICACVAAVLAQKSAIAPEAVLPFTLRIGNAFVSCIIYLWQMFYPFGLAVFYPFPIQLPFWKAVLALLALLAITVGAFSFRLKRPYLLVGWFWYLGMLVPVIGLVQVGLQGHADRYTYLPQIGLYFALTWTVADLSARWHNRHAALGAIAVGIIVSLSLVTFIQAGCWRDSESLWNHALACTQNNEVANDNLGTALLENGQADEAIAHFRKALEIQPDDALTATHLGMALAQQGQSSEAFTTFQNALAKHPRDAIVLYDYGIALLHYGQFDQASEQLAQALEIQSDYAPNLHQLGNTMLHRGQAGQAAVVFQTILKVYPEDPEAHYVLGMISLLQGKPDQAVVHLEEVLKSQPNNPQAQDNLGLALLQTGRVTEALTHFQKAVELQPNNAEAHSNLAWVLAVSPDASIRNGDRAVAEAEQANQLAGGSNPKCLGTLAAAYAETGRFSDAITTARRALQLAQGQNTAASAAIIAALEGQLKLYEANSPYHDPTLKELSTSKHP